MPFNYKTELSRYRRYYQSLERFTKEPRTNAYTTAIFSFLAVSLFGWYAIRPTINTILFLRRQIADNKKVSQQMEEKITNLIEAQALYQRAQLSLPTVKQALPENPEAIELLAQFHSLADVSEASISSVTVASAPLLGTNPSTQKTPNKKVVDVPVTIVVVGTYTSIKSFLDGIADMRRILTVDAVSLLPEKEETGSAELADITIRATLKLTAHYFGIEKKHE